MLTGVDGCGVVVWFGKYTDIASLVWLSFWFYPTSLYGNRIRMKLFTSQRQHSPLLCVSACACVWLPWTLRVSNECPVLRLVFADVAGAGAGAVVFVVVVVGILLSMSMHRQLALCWRLAFGVWRLSIWCLSIWHLAFGIWHLTFDIWH